MKNNLLQLSAIGFVIALIAAGCGQATPDPVEEAKKGAALAADAKRHGEQLSQRRR